MGFVLRGIIQLIQESICQLNYSVLVLPRFLSFPMFAENCCNGCPRPHSMASLSPSRFSIHCTEYFMSTNLLRYIYYPAISKAFHTFSDTSHFHFVCNFNMISMGLMMVSQNAGDRKNSLGVTTICSIEFDWIGHSRHQT